RTVAIDALASDSVEALGDVCSLDPNGCRGAGLGEQPAATVTETVLRIFVAGSHQEEEDLAVHQTRLVEGGPAGAVGDVNDVVHGLQLNERHPAAATVVHHVDAEIRFLNFLIGSVRDQSQAQTNRDANDGVPYKHGRPFGGYSTNAANRFEPSLDR